MDDIGMHKAAEFDTKIMCSHVPVHASDLRYRKNMNCEMCKCVIMMREITANLENIAPAKHIAKTQNILCRSLIHMWYVATYVTYAFSVSR
jgi:hypothetical protein